MRWRSAAALRPAQHDESAHEAHSEAAVGIPVEDEEQDGEADLVEAKAEGQEQSGVVNLSRQAEGCEVGGQEWLRQIGRLCIVGAGED